MKKKFFTFFLALAASVWMSFAKEGALTGAFTINASGDQIVFSKGNLQYQASTQTWRFAENQYDTIGGANSNISASYSGWIDLFGWGTGNNPINTSQSTEDYSTFVDWGNNIDGGWRTLTKDEWVYLFCGRTDAAHLFGMGSVNGVNGTIVLPDDWAGDKFTDTDNGLDYNEQGESYGNNAGERYSFHTYTAEQWRTMEEAGAVFLPAPGNRYGTNVINVNSAGFYWSSTPSNLEGEAYYLYISSYGLNPHYSNGRHNAISVRLVTAAIPNSITINGTPAVGDNSISLTYYFNPANVSRFDMYYAPCLKVKCVTDNTYDEMWLSNTQISSGTETINLNTLGEFKAGKSYVVCFAYKTGDWVDEVFQSFSFPGEVNLTYTPANAEIVWHDDLANPDNNWRVEAIDLSNSTSLHIISVEDAGLTEIAGTYAWADLMQLECGITSFASDPSTDMHFTNGSCTVTVNGSDTTLTGTFTGEDGNTYIISISNSAPLTFTATAGSGGFNDDESHAKLIDGKYVESDWTKWCTNNDRKSTPDGESEACWWVDFQASEAIDMTGYILTTGNDNLGEHGRNPRDWVIKAKLNADDAWTTIASVTNDTKLQDKNFEDYEFDLDTPGKYKYFRFEVLANQSGSVMQLCELRFTKEETPTAIDNANANANAKAVKRIENGQLLIIRDGKTYNVVGTIVR